MKVRQRLTASLAIGLAGAWLAWEARFPLTRGAALVALVAALLLWIVSVRDLHRHRQGRGYLRHVAIAYAPHAGLAVLLAMALRLWLVLAPVAVTPIYGLSPEALAMRVAADTAHLQQLRAATPGVRARLETLARQQPLDEPALRQTWREALTLAARCEKLTAVYQAFHEVDAVAEPSLHAAGFALAFSAFAQESLLARAVARAAENPDVRRLLDTPDPVFGRRTCTRAIRSLASDKSLLRLHAGAAYLALVRDSFPVDSTLLPVVEADLAEARAGSETAAIEALADPLREIVRLHLPASFPLRHR